jgi:hypothetical protein
MNESWIREKANLLSKLNEDVTEDSLMISMIQADLEVPIPFYYIFM